MDECHHLKERWLERKRGMLIRSKDEGDRERSVWEGKSERGSVLGEADTSEAQLSNGLMLPHFKSLLKTSDHTSRLPAEDLRQSLAGGEAGKLHLLPPTTS